MCACVAASDLEHLLEGVLPREDVVGELVVGDALLPRRRREAPPAAPSVRGLYEVLHVVWREAVVESVSREILLVEAPLLLLRDGGGGRVEGGFRGGSEEDGNADLTSRIDGDAKTIIMAGFMCFGCAPCRR